MSYTATLPRPDTVSITVSGPSTALAYARVLAAKARGWAGAVVTYVKMAIRTITRIPKAVANVALSALSTRIGYDTFTTVVGKAARFLGRLASKAVRMVGRGLRKAAGFVTGLVRHVAPKVADAADRASEAVAAVADAVVTTIEVALTSVSQIIGALVRSPLVIVATIRAAGIASAALAVHALTKGAAAARIVRAIPAAMTGVVWATNPWKLLAAVVGVMAGAMAFAAFRLGRAVAPTDPTPDWDVTNEDVSDWEPRDTTALSEELFEDYLSEVAFSNVGQATFAATDAPADTVTDLGITLMQQATVPGTCLDEDESAMPPAAACVEHNVSDPDLALAVPREPEEPLAEVESEMATDEVTAVVASLRVVIAVDGSIEVHGIPASLPEDEQRRIAQTAADAAAQQLRRIARRGRPLRSADRRHVTKAAQAAVLASVNRLAPMAA
jgi:hypothetical protein